MKTERGRGFDSRHLHPSSATPRMKEVTAHFPRRAVTRALSSLGRAPASHAGGRRFDPGRVHVASRSSAGARLAIGQEPCTATDHVLREPPDGQDGTPL